MIIIIRDYDYYYDYYEVSLCLVFVLFRVMWFGVLGGESLV